MRVVDLRSTATVAPPTVDVLASSAAELARLVGTVLADDPAGFDIGADRVAAVRGRVPADLLDAARRVAGGDDKAFLVLALLAGELPPPGDVAQLLAALRDDPSLAWRAVLAHHAQGVEGAPGELLPRIVEGDPGAVATLRELAEQAPCPASVEALLSQPPEVFGTDAADVLERFEEAIWSDLEAEAMGPIHRDVAHRRKQLAGGVEPAAVVVEATNGYELTDDPQVERVVLLPSYWFRPWLVIARRRIDDHEVEYISTAVADEFLALPKEAPTPSMLRLFKALSDEGRLKLLRRMSSGPISLAEATRELEVAKATAHHHLSILRQAGLVTIRGEGRAKRYALREDAADAAHQALAGYVRP